MYLRIKDTVRNIKQMHLNGIWRLQNENLKPPKLRNAVFESLVCLKNDKHNILCLQFTKIVIESVNS